MQYLRDLGNSVLDAIPGILAAIVILLLALLVSWLAKVIVTKALKATKLDKKLNRVSLEDKKGATTVDYLGRLVFIIVFILFLPSIFAYLGLEGVAAPIGNMVNAIINFIPNIFAAALILFIGFFVAKIIRDLLIPLLRKIGLDRFQSPKKTAATDAAASAPRLSTIVANIVYVLILIPIVIASLQALKIEAISLPAISMLNQIFVFIPQLLMALVLITLGAFIARFVGNLLTQLLEGVGADKWISDLMPSDVSLPKFSLSKLVGRLAQIVILLFFIVEGLNVIRLEILQMIGAAIITYLPNVLVSVVILLAALFLASWLESFIKLKLRDSRGVAILAKVTIMILALFIVFDQLNIAASTINTAFSYMMLGLSVAFALAFGLGGRDFARKTLDQVSKRAEEVASDYRETEDRKLEEEMQEASFDPAFTADPPFAAPDVVPEDLSDQDDDPILPEL